MAKKRANGEGNIRKRKDGRWEGPAYALPAPRRLRPFSQKIRRRANQHAAAPKTNRLQSSARTICASLRGEPARQKRSCNGIRAFQLPA